MTQDNGNGARGTGTALTSLTDIPFVADMFSFGDSGTNNAIYRLELGESDDKPESLKVLSNTSC